MAGVIVWMEMVLGSVGMRHVLSKREKKRVAEGTSSEYRNVPQPTSKERKIWAERSGGKACRGHASGSGSCADGRVVRPKRCDVLYVMCKGLSRDQTNVRQ